MQNFQHGNEAWLWDRLNEATAILGCWIWSIRTWKSWWNNVCCLFWLSYFKLFASEESILKPDYTIHFRYFLILKHMAYRKPSHNVPQAHFQKRLHWNCLLLWNLPLAGHDTTRKGSCRSGSSKETPAQDRGLGSLTMSSFTFSAVMAFNFFCTLFHHLSQAAPKKRISKAKAADCTLIPPSFPVFSHSQSIGADEKACKGGAPGLWVPRVHFLGKESLRHFFCSGSSEEMHAQDRGSG